MKPGRADQLAQEVRDLEARLADLKKRLPAHSIPPALMAELDELEDAIEETRRLLAQTPP